MTTTPSAWKGTSALASNPCIRTAIGLHPQLAHERIRELDLFDEFLDETRYVGEIGLDGSPEFRATWDSQVTVFEHILQRCSSAGGRILSIHSRRASGAVLKYLEHYQASGTPVLHWFSGTQRDLRQAVDLGCWFSVGPAMLGSENGQKLTALMPRERVVTESDGPFAQIRGQIVMPWNVQEAEKALARIWNVREDSASRMVRDNFRTLCSLVEERVLTDGSQSRNEPLYADDSKALWIFGYGSLMDDGWEKGFGCLRRSVATLAGYRRVFNKPSKRNRGTPQFPCPTLNLETAENAACTGIAFEFPGNRGNEVQSYLSKREGKDFPLKQLPIRFENNLLVSALVPMYEGKNLLPMDNRDITAAMVLKATGARSSCVQYIEGIAHLLSKLHIEDEVVSDLWQAVQARLRVDSST